MGNAVLPMDVQYLWQRFSAFTYVIYAETAYFLNLARRPYSP